MCIVSVKEGIKLHWYIIFFIFFSNSGNVGVILFNHSNEDFEVAPGDRIAQLICEKITYPKIEEVDTLTDTSRGAEGFGSTGTK